MKRGRPRTRGTTQTRIFLEDQQEVSVILKSLNSVPGPSFTSAAFFNAAIESWKKLHCPECGAELCVRPCVCKAR